MSRRRQMEDWIADKHLDLESENELLRKELAKALCIEEPKVRRVPATYRRRKGTFRKHFVLPDTQVKPGVPTEHLTWAGRYIREKAEPGDVVVHLGDHWDMPSLSSYDKGKKSFEGRRIRADFEAGNKALALLDDGIGDAKVEKHMLRGNHEDRVTRLLQLEPWLIGIIGLDDSAVIYPMSPGWHVHDFLKAVEIDGILYAHYFYTPTTGRARGGMAANVLRHVGRSFVMGHRQVHDIAMMELPDGGRRRGVISGAFYQHDEEYLGPQSSHWRGMLMLTEVQDGDFDVCEVSLDFLRRRYAR